MRTFYLTDVGKVRDHNEDSVIIVKNNEGNYLMAVADGMGGHSCGEVASSIVITYLAHRFQEDFYKMSKEDAITFVNDCIVEVNHKIFKYEESHPESKGMGTTLVMAIITNDYIIMSNIGDSSGFVLKKNKLHKITIDHTLVNYLVLAGELTEEEAKNHPRKNILMKALGANDPIEADIFDCDMDIDGIFLCSDGATNMLDVEQMEKVLYSELDIEDKIVKLIHKCNNRGGLDNISMAYLDFKEGDEK
jgi:protein phosphatase